MKSTDEYASFNLYTDEDGYRAYMFQRATNRQGKMRHEGGYLSLPGTISAIADEIDRTAQRRIPIFLFSDVANVDSQCLVCIVDDAQLGMIQRKISGRRTVTLGKPSVTEQTQT